MGWNGSDRTRGEIRPCTTHKHSSTGDGLWGVPFRRISFTILGLIAAGGIGLGSWFLFRPGESESEGWESAKPLRCAKAKPLAAANVVKAKPIAQRAVPAKSPEGKLAKAVTNKTGTVIEDYTLPDGTTRRVIRPPRQVWDNAADQLIAMAVSIQAGFEAAPMPEGVSDEEFRRALKKPIVINADDSEKLKELKKTVREARNVILDEMTRTGKSFEEIVQTHHADMNAGTRLYHDAVKGLEEVRKTGTPEDVNVYITAMNAVLQQAGAKELTLDTEEEVSGNKE